MERIMGVLGGMGPLATVDFMQKIINATPAHSDQDHIPVITASLPQIPDRNDAISGIGQSPLGGMINVIKRLERAGAGAIAIPCNTAHCWHAALQHATTLPILHIADAAIDLMISKGVSAGCGVGILATTSTLTEGIYRDRLNARALNCIEPDSSIQEDCVMEGIRAVKAGDLSGGSAKLMNAAAYLRRSGAEKIVLACTEIPVALAHAGGHDPIYVDATDALAKACVVWATSEDFASVKQVA